MPSLNIKLVLAAMLLAVGAAGGFTTTSLYYRAQISDIKLAQANKDKATQAAATAALLSAQRSGDDLSNRLAQAESTLNLKSLEVSREVSRLAIGRNCLSADLVSLLNQSTAASGVATAPASAPVAADAAFATDQDVGEWIVFAQSQYDTCRARLGALIDWVEP